MRSNKRKAPAGGDRFQPFVVGRQGMYLSPFRGSWEFVHLPRVALYESDGDVSSITRVAAHEVGWRVVFSPLFARRGDST